MIGFLRVNDQKETVILYANQDPDYIIDLTLLITVFLLDDEGVQTSKGLDKVLLDGKEIALNLAKETKTWQACPTISSAQGVHKVEMILTNGCSQIIEVEIKDLSEQATGEITGIFPRPNMGIVSYNNSNNASNVETVKGCRASYYGDGCEKTLDYDSLNAIFSELGNLVNSAGMAYNCGRLTNLTDAVWRIAERSDHEKFVIDEVNETSSPALTDNNYLPISVQNRYTLNELYSSVLNNNIDEARLSPCLLAKSTFNLIAEAKVYFKLSGRLRRERPIDFIVDNDAFLVIRIDGNFYLYDDDKKSLGDYSLINLGVVTPYVEHIELVGEPTVLPQGEHTVELFIIQYGDNPFPTDIKYRENLPRFRVNKNKPVLKFKIMRGVYNN